MTKFGGVMNDCGQNRRYKRLLSLKKIGFALIALITLAVAISSNLTLPAQASTSQAPIRTVEGQVLISNHLPAIRLEFDKEFQYVGGHTFVLYEVAQAEQHFFVEADQDKRIKRLYWVQFEGYLPGNNQKYNYKASKTIKLGGLEFIADAYARNIKANPGRPDSDGNRARAFLDSKGYSLASDEILSQRLVHLTDETKRNELMIIYLEDLSKLGVTASDVAPGGRAAPQWEEMTKALLTRVTKGIKVSH
jgi:hypothetical protein